MSSSPRALLAVLGGPRSRPEELEEHGDEEHDQERDGDPLRDQPGPFSEQTKPRPNKDEHQAADKELRHRPRDGHGRFPRAGSWTAILAPH